MNLFRYADRPDLLAIRFETLSRQTFPEYMNHNVPGGKYWGRLYEDYPDQIPPATMEANAQSGMLGSIVTAPAALPTV